MQRTTSSPTVFVRLYRKPNIQKKSPNPGYSPSFKGANSLPSESSTALKIMCLKADILEKFA
ncbi:hypothetical protein [Peribacillus muralis]|uniref:hypothetical protein n=1 Tax=Peribacillus muralis TaxID=264697 RepID=UPI003CFD51C0